jgi:uncharacterized BrkB/YihY/UPF0761 family membrane protein
MGDGRDPGDPTPLEFDAPPTIPGRIARWTERIRIVRSQVEAARARHASVDLAFEFVERDSTIGGGMLGGALAYRLFVFLLPLSLFLVAGVGIYADTTGLSPSEVVSRSGLTGLIASEVSAAASSSARWAIFILTFPVVVYALAVLYRAVAIVHAIAWLGSGRGVRLSPRGFGLFAGTVVAMVVSAGVLGWIRGSDGLAGVVGLVAYAALVGGAWLAVARRLPHPGASLPELVPGAVLFAAGMLLVNAFNVYVTARLVENRADTYGALGIAAALLFSLYLLGRLVVGSAVLNATLHARRTRDPAEPAQRRSTSS